MSHFALMLVAKTEHFYRLYEPLKQPQILRMMRGEAISL
jgi:hypothetical protein